ncbi:MAG: hypothetical protein GF330_04060 [Candidatus Eisenbacteria bacterium]|nr:hypothetical protein [Candidatus Eisenbacteria bacterium]
MPAPLQFARRPVGLPGRAHRPVMAIFATLLALLACSCSEDLQDVVTETEFVAELSVAQNHPQIRIASEDSVAVETLDCAQIWDDPEESRLGCLLEKRRYASGNRYRIAVGLTDYDAADSLVGYVATINARNFYYGTVDSGSVACGQESELPIVELEIDIAPASRLSAHRAAAGISEVLIDLGAGTRYGCHFDAESEIEEEWIIFSLPSSSQCRPSDLGSSFIPDVGGEYLLGWRLTSPAGSDTDSLQLVATEEHRIEYLAGTVLPEGPGIWWEDPGFWYVDTGGLRQVRVSGSGLDFIPYPVAIDDPAGICSRGDELWISGGDGLGGMQLFAIGRDGSLTDNVPISDLGVTRAVLACDSTRLWIGAWQGTDVQIMGSDQQIVGSFEVPDSLGVITDLACDGEALWVAVEALDGSRGGLLRLSGAGDLLATWPLEFVRPMGVAFDGTTLVVLDEASGGITPGRQVVKLTLQR